jgi:hypothetical protein
MSEALMSNTGPLVTIYHKNVQVTTVKRDSHSSWSLVVLLVRNRTKRLAIYEDTT